MNTALTPQALYLPHRQIAEVSARRQAERDTFERAAAQLRPSWAPRVSPEVVTPESSSLRSVAPPTSARAPDAALQQTLRLHAAQRADADAERYRRQLLRDLGRTQQNVRKLFVAAFVALCALLALGETSAPAHSEGARTAAARPLASD
jgi:hypothetical protein